MTIIGIVGPSLDNIPNDSKLIEKLKGEVWSICHDWAPEAQFASGGATGIDEWTKQYAVDEGHSFKEFKPSHEHWDATRKDRSGNLICPTPDFCYGFKARNMALAGYVGKLYCITFNIEDLEWTRAFHPVVCYHCLRRTPKEMAAHITHQASGGCWTLHYAEDLDKQVELIEVTDW